MAIDAYMTFQEYGGRYLEAESQFELKGPDDKLGLKEIVDKFKAAGKGRVFEVDNFNFDIEQTLNIGSQSTGAGAGRVQFNPFSIERKIDRSSPDFFQKACSGTPYKEVVLGLRKSGGGDVSGAFFLMFRFLLVAVKTVAWANGDEAPTETITFEYGALQILYGKQDANGMIKDKYPAGWNRVKNVRDEDLKSEIAA